MTAPEHPNQKEIDDYCAGLAPFALSSEIEEHLRDCTECRLRVVAAVRQQIKGQSAAPPREISRDSVKTEATVRSHS
jgi:hypothetical protein